MLKGKGIKYGVIGAGVMGRHHARIASLLPGVSLVGIAEPHPAQANVLPDTLKPLVVADYKELINEVEALSIATPAATHFLIARDCLNAGKHILIEKPFTGSSELANKLTALSKAKNCVLSVGFIERFNPAFIELSKLIKKETIIGIDIKRFSPFPARINDTNVIFDMMIHDLDLLLALLPNEEIDHLKAEGKIIKSNQLDQVLLTVFFRSGIIAKVSADRVCDEKIRKFFITTEKALYEADLLNKNVYLRDLITHVPTAHHIKRRDQLTLELIDFFTAIKSGTPPRVTSSSGFFALKLAEEVKKACS